MDSWGLIDQVSKSWRVCLVSPYCFPPISVKGSFENIMFFQNPVVCSALRVMWSTTCLCTYLWVYPYTIFRGCGIHKEEENQCSQNMSYHGIRRLWCWSRDEKGCWASDPCPRLQFKVCKCETTGYFQGKKHFKAKHLDLFLTLTKCCLLLNLYHYIISAVLIQDTIKNWT